MVRAQNNKEHGLLSFQHLILNIKGEYSSPWTENVLFTIRIISPIQNENNQNKSSSWEASSSSIMHECLSFFLLNKLLYNFPWKFKAPILYFLFACEVDSICKCNVAMRQTIDLPLKKKFVVHTGLGVEKT